MSKLGIFWVNKSFCVERQAGWKWACERDFLPLVIRWFLSIALHIPTAHNFCIISMCIHNERNFTQVKLNSEINAGLIFFWMSMVTYIFCWIIIVYILSSLKKIQQYFYQAGKKYRWKHPQNKYTGMQIMTAKATTILERFMSTSFQILYDSVPYARHVLPVKFFSQVLLT